MSEKYINHALEEVSVNLTFKEERVRGTEKFKCVIVAEDADAPDQSISDSIEASSWDAMKKAYSTLKDLLEHMFWSEHWRVFSYYNEDDDRYILLNDCSGYEGIYELNPNEEIRVLWSDIKDNEIVYPK